MSGETVTADEEREPEPINTLLFDDNISLMQTLKSQSSRRISKSKRKRLSNKLRGLNYRPYRTNRKSFQIENNPKELARLISERMKRFGNTQNKARSMYHKPAIFNIKEDTRE